MIHLASGFHLVDMLHPLRYWGYQFWSGIGSDVGEITILGGALALIKHHNCHVKGCWRMGGHQVDGTPFKTCKKHHPAMPDGDTTVEHIRQAHKQALAGGSGPETSNLGG